MTNYFLSLPQPAFEYWAWLESERLIDPVMRQFYKERDVVMEERRMRYENDPGGKLYEGLLSVAYQQHQYRHPVIGYAQDISGLMADQLAEFHQKHYVPENIAIGVVGSIDPDRDVAILERYFGRLARRAPPELKTTVEPLQVTERRFVVKKDAAPQFMVAYHKPAFPDHDDPPISIFEEILAGGPLSPLYQGLVKKGHYASTVSAEEAPGLLFPNLVVFGIDPLSTVGNKACLEAFDAILKATIARGVTEKELEIAKRRVARRFLDQLDSNSTLAHNFATSTLIYGSWSAMLTWYQETMAVTVADVNRVARQYFRDELRTVGLLEREDSRANK
jgi:predicted Zn-dependent peptidase